MARGSYSGGSTILRTGAYGDPSGRGIGRQSSRALKGSARMPGGILARKIPHLKAAMSLLARLCDAETLRLHNLAQIRTFLDALTSFEHEVTHKHRLAYDNGTRLVDEALPHARRQLGAKHEALARLQSLQRLYT